MGSDHGAGQKGASSGAETWQNEGAWETGGGSTWITGTYDPELGLVYWGTGNPGPDFDGSVRPGDNLYTSSVIALDPDDGSMRWHYQWTPHDVWDYDGINENILLDKDGKKLLAHAVLPERLMRAAPDTLGRQP